MMGEIVTEVVRVTTTGEDGSGAGEALSGVLHGFLLDIHLDFHGSAPGSTDTTVSYADRGGNILVVSNSVTDGLFAPRQKPVDNANAAITNASDRFPLNGRVKVALAGSNALTDAVVAYIRYQRVG